jgi:hypothetical protein
VTGRPWLDVPTPLRAATGCALRATSCGALCARPTPPSVQWDLSQRAVAPLRRAASGEGTRSFPGSGGGCIRRLAPSSRCRMVNGRPTSCGRASSARSRSSRTACGGPLTCRLFMRMVMVLPIPLRLRLLTLPMVDGAFLLPWLFHLAAVIMSRRMMTTAWRPRRLTLCGGQGTLRRPSLRPGSPRSAHECSSDSPTVTFLPAVPSAGWCARALTPLMILELSACKVMLGLAVAKGSLAP